VFVLARYLDLDERLRLFEAGVDDCSCEGVFVSELAVRRRRGDDPGWLDTAAIADLPERERLVITLYDYEELTMREIAPVLGVTESRVSQIHATAACTSAPDFLASQLPKTHERD
jgi:hypothetical protein